MPPYQRILVTTDFSTDSEEALRHALSLHQQLRIDPPLHLLHVVDGSLTLPLEGASGASLGRKEHERALIQEAKTRLGKLIAQQPGDGAQIVSAVRAGTPASQVIAQYAEDQGVDVIVVGVQGRGGALRRLVMGSTAQQLIQRAACPILVIPRVA